MSQPVPAATKRKTILWLVYSAVIALVGVIISYFAEALVPEARYWLPLAIRLFAFVVAWLPPIVWMVRTLRSTQQTPSGPV